MKIFGISLIKNEADIIKYSLTESSKWAEKIFVFDNGSTDGTWEIVKELSKKNPVIVPWKSESKPFRDGIRGEIYNNFKHLAKKGDWWCCRLDCDEFYIDDPRDFLKSIPSIYQVVTSESFEYKLTYEDDDEYDFKNHFPEDEHLLNYYSPRSHSETRFFRHRDRLHWSNDLGYPKYKGVISPQKIRLKHYQYRSPAQIKKRVQTRIQATKEGYKHFGRDNVDSWKDKLMHRSELILETPDFKKEWIHDNNIIPWYWHYYRMVMHAIGIYP